MTSIPLSSDDTAKLIRLAFAWNCSPRVALRRALDAAVVTVGGMDLTLMSITCPTCHMQSFSQGDIMNGYCGNCREFTNGTVQPVPVAVDGSDPNGSDPAP